MNFKISIIIISIFFSINSYAQTIEEIKADRDKYIWGEGKGMSLDEADNAALHSLISQISTVVESKSSLVKDEKLGDKDSYNEEYKASINTYSKATLRNTKRIVIANEPNAEVFRYIKKKEINKVFFERKNKILDFCNLPAMQKRICKLQMLYATIIGQ